MARKRKHPWLLFTTEVTKILKKQRGCVFCKIFKAKKDKANYIFLRTKYSFAVLNIYLKQKKDKQCYAHIVNSQKLPEKRILYEIAKIGIKDVKI